MGETIKVAEPPDTEQLFDDGALIDAALRSAVRQALLRHKRAGVPVAIGRDNTLIELPADQIEIEVE